MIPVLKLYMTAGLGFKIFISQKRIILFGQREINSDIFTNITQTQCSFHKICPSELKYYDFTCNLQCIFHIVAFLITV